VEGVREEARAAAPAAPQLRALLGVNGFAFMYDKNPAFVAAVGALREYSDWEWTERNASLNSFQPATGVGFMLDDWYSNATRDALRAHMCMQSFPAWTHDFNESMRDWKPLNASTYATPGAATLPASYDNIASHAFQVAARYGRVAVPLNQLLLAPGQPARSGLGTMAELEVLNEANGDWTGREAYFAPYEYAAALSAAFDGHGGALGAGRGARAADPSFRVVMTGLSWPGSARTAIDYVDSVRSWAAANRADGAFPADVVNMHIYCRNAAGTVGVSPEDCGLADTLSQLCAYRDAALPRAELWLSEFGYDTSAPSPQLAPPIGAQGSDVTQAQWLVRSVLAIAQAGAGGAGGAGGCVQRAHMYMLGDVDSAGSGVFATSGLMTAPDYSPKLSFFHYSAFLARLGDATPAGPLGAAALPAGVAGLCFDLGGGARAAVLWLPSSSGAARPARVAVAGAAAGACAVARGGDAAVRLVAPQRGVIAGNETALPVAADGTAQLTVTETPVILLPAAA